MCVRVNSVHTCAYPPTRKNSPPTASITRSRDSSQASISSPYWSVFAGGFVHLLVSMSYTFQFPTISRHSRGVPAQVTDCELHVRQRTIYKDLGNFPAEQRSPKPLCQVQSVSSVSEPEPELVSPGFCCSNCSFLVHVTGLPSPVLRWILTTQITLCPHFMPIYDTFMRFSAGAKKSSVANKI